MKKIAVGIIVVGIIIGGTILLMNRDSLFSFGSVAVVNGEKISKSEFKFTQAQVFTQQGIDSASLDTEQKKEIDGLILDMIISQKVLAQAASKAGYEVTDEEVNMQFDTLKGQFTNDEEFANALKAESLTETTLRENLKKDLAVEKYLEKELNLSMITSTEEEILSAYTQASQEQELQPLEEIRADITRYVIEQKKQKLVAEFVSNLRTSATIETSL